MEESIKIFEGKSVRVVRDNEQQEWYFSVVDVVAVLTDSVNPTDYLKKMRKRDPELQAYIGTNCPQVQMQTESGKYRKTLAANADGISRIIQPINSTKKDDFILWMKQFSRPVDVNNNELQVVDSEILGGEIAVYQPNETVRLTVRLNDETVWLTQPQIVELFQSSKSNVSEHISNIYEQGELPYGATVRKFRTVQTEGGRQVIRELDHYNLDVIISVGFRVNAKRGIKFRQWANRVIKSYLLRGYAINQRLVQMEQRIDARFDAQDAKIQQIESTLADHQEKIDFFVRTNQPPVVGIFHDGQVFSARLFVEDLIKTAQHEVVLIDNYIDAKTFDLLDVRNAGVTATIYTERVTAAIQQLLGLHNQEHPNAPVQVCACSHPFHDRFLIIDDQLWHCGASFKDLGRKLFAIDKMAMDKNIILNQL